MLWILAAFLIHAAVKCPFCYQEPEVFRQGCKRVMYQLAPQGHLHAVLQSPRLCLRLLLRTGRGALLSTDSKAGGKPTPQSTPAL